MEVGEITNLNIVALVVVAAFSEQPVVNHIVDIKLIKKRIAVLHQVSFGQTPSHYNNAYL